MDDRRVVITGLGVTTPLGLGIEALWDGLLEKKCAIGRIQQWDPSGLPCQLAGELPDFKLGDFIPKGYRKSIKVMARDIVIAVVSSYLAVKDGGLTTKCLVDRGEAGDAPIVDSTRFGANIGAGLICADLVELAGALNTAVDDGGKFSLIKWGEEGMTNLTPLWLLKFLPNMLACHVTIIHDAQAPSNTITCGEASSHLAIGEAFRTIQRGAADVCICGGAETKLHPMAIARHTLWGRLNTDDNDSPHRSSLPFGAKRRGMVPSEGGGLVILESLEHAKRRGARIYAELAGFGAGSSAASWNKPDPDGRSIMLAIQKALADADTTKDDIDLVTPFGAGTPEHDASEMAGWNAAMGETLNETYAMTTRGALGNNGAGTGAIDFAAMVVALERNTVPVSINTDDLDEGCRFRFAQDDPKDVPIRQAITAAPALAGGQSAALIIRRYEESIGE